jgi:hypothetical protein
MPWVKLDDTFWSNRKLERLSDRAYRLYMRSLGYCSQYLTDGVMDTTDLRTIGATPKVCQELVAGGCWDPVPDGGYQIHDYLQFQPSRHEVMEKRRKEAEKKAGQRGVANRNPDTGKFT